MSEIDEEDDEDMILDRTKMIPQSNTLGLNQFNIGLYSDRKHTSNSKSIVVITTCLMIVCEILCVRCFKLLFIFKGYFNWFNRRIDSMFIRT